MLEGLDDIDWSKLVHAYGPATDVPEQLRKLASQRADERIDAMNELCGTIWHQGSVYEATAFAVPFLIELLETEGVDGKSEILVLLAHLAKGTSYHEVYQSNQHLRIFNEPAQSPEWRAKLQAGLALVRDVKTGVKAGQAVYLEFLVDEDCSLRESAAYVLGSLESPDPQLAQKVWDRFERDEEEGAKVCHLLAFGNLAEPLASNLALLSHVFNYQRSNATRLAAAMSTARLDSTRLPLEGIQVLFDALKYQEKYKAFANTIWVRVKDFESMIENQLMLLKGQPALEVVTILTYSLSSLDHDEVIKAARILLTIAFGGPSYRRTTFDSLDEQQKSVLTLLVRSPKFWTQGFGSDESITYHASSMMSTFGLPNHPEKLKAFVGG